MAELLLTFEVMICFKIVFLAVENYSTIFFYFCEESLKGWFLDKLKRASQGNRYLD